MKPFLVTLLALLFGCATTAPVKTQSYGQLANTKAFEEEFETVWRGIVDATSEYKVLENDSEKGTVKTDWIYTTSNDKYIEYQVNNLPRKRYLQTRYRYFIRTERQVGAVRVTVESEEEVELLRSDGTPDGWKSVSPDSSRQNELLRSIELKILQKS